MITQKRQKRWQAYLWFVMAGCLMGTAMGLLLGGCGKVSSHKSSKPEQASAAVAAAATPSGIRFANVAAASGIRFRWPQQPRPMRNKEAFGRGCAFLDYDDDGWQDVLLIGETQVALYRNVPAEGSVRRFVDVSAAAGLAARKGDWIGCAVGDYNGDRFLDLLLTGYHQLALLENVRGTRFVDRTAAAGLDPRNRNHWGSSAGFMDLDANGTLDLVLLNYVIFGPDEKQYCELTPGVRSGCPPQEYSPEFGELWQNRGNGTFKDVTASSGMKDTNGKALVVAFSDIDDDGRVDFYIGNDGTPAELMHNQGSLRFKNVGAESGVAYGATGSGIAAMGADWGDYNRDSLPDLIVTAFSNESYPLFRNLGDGIFEDAAGRTDISQPTLKPLGFGAKWLDMDNDGWLDIMIANGHVYDNASQIDPLSTFRQPLMLFHNQQGQRFTDLVPALGGEIAEPLLGRGSATADFDNDGKMDFVVVDFEGEARLFHNRSQTPNHWITLDLRGKGPNRFAYGAKVTARAGKQTWTAFVSPASSYLSSSDPRIHLGLGSVTSLDSVTIIWPSGHQEVLRSITADRVIRIEEKRGIVKLPPPTL